MTLRSKEDITTYFSQLEGATVKYRQTGNGRFSFGSAGTHYSRDEAEIEGFLRLLWGVGPAEANQRFSDFDFYTEAILAGVNPDSDHYWGDIGDYHHLMVEMASLALTLMLTKVHFWDTLPKSDQDSLVAWLDQINQYQVHPNNWLFFRILVNVTFMTLGEPANHQRLAEDLEKIHQMYLGDGWYCDGNPEQMDYYIPWAMHFYGLIYSKYMAVIDPENSQVFRERARLFAKSYMYWFDCRGAGIPFGRSLTYRFAQSAFWSALVFADVEALPWGEVKDLLYSNLEYWQAQEMTKSDGVLSVGYHYENLLMSESYNGPGSPYWAFKTFLVMAVPDEHPFWTAERQASQWAPFYVNQTIGFVFQHHQPENALLFPSNQFTKQVHATEKYSKFVYSSRFGFSITKGTIGLEEGAFDNTLAIAEAGQHHFVTKEKGRSQLVESYLVHRWQPMPEVAIVSYIVPINQWHARIHVIDSQRALEIADGGFANASACSHATGEPIQTDYVEARSEKGRVASKGIYGYESTQLIYPSANTHLLDQHTVLPTLLATHSPGKGVYVSLHGASVEDLLERPPTIDISDKHVVIPEINCHIPLDVDIVLPGNN